MRDLLIRFTRPLPPYEGFEPPSRFRLTGYITILSIRLSASQYTAIYQEAYVFTQGRSSPMPHLENWWSEIRTHEPEGTDLQSACFVHLHIHQ